MTTYSYVYGIARSDHPPIPATVRGIGDPPRPVRAVAAGGLTAVVSDCPGQLRAKRRDLLAHQNVLAEVGAAGPVLPMRFGSLSQGDDAVRAVLTERAEHWMERLAALDGKVEYNVKAVHEEEAVLRLVVAEDPRIRELKDANRAAGGGTYQDRLRLGEMVAAAVQAREERDARLVQEELAPRADARATGPGSSGSLVNVSFLVPRADGDAFVSAARDLQERHPHLRLRINGPLPPYSFVEPEPE